MSEQLKKDWQWSDLDPLTRSIVATFSWSIGDESQGNISDEAFTDAMTKTFLGITHEDVIKIAQWGGAEGMRNTVVNKLSSFDRDSISDMTQRLGQLAGGTEALVELASQTGKQLSGERIKDAIPALRVLSELAIERR